MSQQSEPNFFDVIPRSHLAWIVGGVGLLFAPLWAIMMAEVVAPGRIWGFLVWCVLAGLTGACYFLGVQYRRWFLVPAVLLSIFVAAGGFFFETLASRTGGWFGPGTRAPVPTLEGGIMLAMLLGAFVMLIRFIGTVATPHLKMRAELGVVAQMHRELVRPVSIVLAGWSAQGDSVASSTMGGDLLELIPREGGFDLVVGDVTGHGVRAGVVMAMTKGVFRAHLTPDVPLVDAVGRINRDLCTLTEPSMFVTAAFVRVRADEAECVIAGHPPILIEHEGTIRRCESSGLPLGVHEGETYASENPGIPVGARALIYSDGLIEATAEEGRQVGIGGLERALRGAASEGLVGWLLSGDAIPGVVWNDDRTIAVLVRTQ